MLVLLLLDAAHQVMLHICYRRHEISVSALDLSLDLLMWVVSYGNISTRFIDEE